MSEPHIIDYHGKIDLKNMPDRSKIHSWEKEARQLYKASSGKSPERFYMEYVGSRIVQWQEQNRARENSGRVC